MTSEDPPKRKVRRVGDQELTKNLCDELQMPLSHRTWQPAEDVSVEYKLGRVDEEVEVVYLETEETKI